MSESIVIVITNQKGVLEKQQVLLIDFDLQGDLGKALEINTGSIKDTIANKKDKILER